MIDANMLGPERRPSAIQDLPSEEAEVHIDFAHTSPQLHNDEHPEIENLSMLNPYPLERGLVERTPPRNDKSNLDFEV